MKSIKYKSEFLNREIELDYVVNNKYKISDAFYFLDGQNAFSDDKATYGRSLHALKYLDKMKKGYIAIAIHSPKTDQERLNMYSPFIIDNGYLKDFKNNPKICLQFVSEIEHIILPYIEHKYKISN